MGSKNILNFSKSFEGRIDSNGSIASTYGGYIGRFENCVSSNYSFSGFKGRIVTNLVICMIRWGATKETVAENRKYL